MGRKFIVGGNWKCNGTTEEVKKIVSTLNAAEVPSEDVVEVVVSPPFVFLPVVKSLLRPDFQVAAQNCWVKKGGAYTGEVSADMLVNLGIPWVILGHSERRALLAESNEFVGSKVAYALGQGLKVIACVGENIEEREAGSTLDVVAAQTKAIAEQIADWTNVVLAYEPLWAIGTGKVAAPDQAQEVHCELRKWLQANVSSEVAASTRIMYGGSVNGGNCKELAAKPDVDGFLVGSLNGGNCKELAVKPDVDGFLVGDASLKPEFIDIIKSEGKIGSILGAVKSYFPDSPSKSSCNDGSDHSSSNSQNFPSSSYYRCMYEELRKIGKGGFGRVFECRHKIDGMTYAVKKIPFCEDNEDEVIREVKIMAGLNHPNVVRYNQAWIEDIHGVLSTDEESYGTDISGSSLPPAKMLYLAMEFCHGTLEHVIANPPQQTPIEKYFAQMARGLTYIHEKGVVHRDLSKQNVLLDLDGNVKIGDFGLAILFDMAAADCSMMTSGPVGNVSYRAPEMTRSPTYINEKIDVFSLGLIFFEMVYRMDTQSERAHIFEKIRNGSLDWSIINMGSHDFIRYLLEIDPCMRASAKEVISFATKCGAV